MPSPVLTKLDFVPRYKKGEFGNASPTWNSLKDWKKRDKRHAKGPFHIRNRIPQGETWYNVSREDMLVTWVEAELAVSASNLYISLMAPHQYNVLQGEVWQSENHLELTYSTVLDLPMRDALRSDLNRTSGLHAVTLLKCSLCPNSWDWLNQLLDNYPNHTVEFSCFSVEWGTVPYYNTVFWEVRNY